MNHQRVLRGSLAKFPCVTISRRCRSHGSDGPVSGWLCFSQCAGTVVVSNKPTSTACSRPPLNKLRFINCSKRHTRHARTPTRYSPKAYILHALVTGSCPPRVTHANTRRKLRGCTPAAHLRFRPLTSMGKLTCTSWWPRRSRCRGTARRMPRRLGVAQRWKRAPARRAPP